MKSLGPVVVGLLFLGVLGWEACQGSRSLAEWQADTTRTFQGVQAREDSAEQMLTLARDLFEAAHQKDSAAEAKAKRANRTYRSAMNLRDSLESMAIPDTCLPLASGWRRTNDSLKVAYDTIKAALDSLRSASAQRDTAKAAFLDVVKLKGESVGDLSALVRRAPVGGCRILGIPCPVAVVGYGAVLSDGVVRAGPSVGIGFRIPF